MLRSRSLWLGAPDEECRRCVVGAPAEGLIGYGIDLAQSL